MSNFFEFEHRCQGMPEDVKFRKIKNGSNSQFSVDNYTKASFAQTTVLYGFKFCPYCGEKVEK